MQWRRNRVRAVRLTVALSGLLALPGCFVFVPMGVIEGDPGFSASVRAVYDEPLPGGGTGGAVRVSGTADPADAFEAMRRFCRDRDTAVPDQVPRQQDPATGEQVFFIDCNG
jgi:hypothetical protein